MMKTYIKTYIKIGRQGYQERMFYMGTPIKGFKLILITGKDGKPISNGEFKRMIPYNIPGELSWQMIQDFISMKSRYAVEILSTEDWFLINI